VIHLLACHEAQVSYREIADAVGCSIKFAKMVAKESESKKIIKKSPTFFTEKLSGKNKYERGENFNPNLHLINDLTLIIRRCEIDIPLDSNGIDKRKVKTKTKIIRKFVPSDHPDAIAFRKKLKGKRKGCSPLKGTNKNSKEFAKASPGRPSVKLEVLKRHGFEKFAKGAPSWWFRDLEKLEKALRLVKSKVKKGFGRHRKINFFKFVSHLLKNEASGYRKWRAMEFVKDFSSPSVQRVNKYFENEFKQRAWEDFSELFNQQKFKLNLDTAQKLLRRGFQHAAKCAEVSLKRLKLGGIKSTTSFTLSLVNMRNPMDILTKNQVRTC
jgi:hypothetical protein